MSLLSEILKTYARHRIYPTFRHLAVQVIQAQTGTIVAAPGAGKRIIVCDGNINSTGAGSGSWYHTSVADGNRLTWQQAHTNNASYRPGPWLLPINTPLLATATTTNLNGWIDYAIVDDPGGIID